jgi:hypothetical protein
VATCNTFGVKTFTCSECGETTTESINKDPNNHENKATTSQQDPTCGVYGEYEKWSCSACGQSGGGGPIPATGNHNYTVFQSATSTTHTYKCANCDATETTNHSWSDETGKCSCGTEHNHNVGDNQWVMTDNGHYRCCAGCWYAVDQCTNPDYVYTSNNDDTHTITCENCDFSISEDHDYVYTYYNDSVHDVTCTHCSSDTFHE